MFLLGAIVNSIAIMIGASIGFRFHHIPERIKNTVMQGIGLFVIALGLSMALDAPRDTLFIVLSIVIGGAIGSWWRIEERLAQIGVALEGKFGHASGEVYEGFMFASLVFCVGSMAVLGGIQSGVDGQNNILYTKSVLDGFSALIFTSTMGLGVGLAAIPVFLYEGAIATLAYFFRGDFHSVPIIMDMTAVGGLLIAGIGINILGLKKIMVGNLLPSLVVVVMLRLTGEHLLSYILHIF